MRTMQMALRDRMPYTMPAPSRAEATAMTRAEPTMRFLRPTRCSSMSSMGGNVMAMLMSVIRMPIDPARAGRIDPRMPTL